MRAIAPREHSWNHNQRCHGKRAREARPGMDPHQLPTGAVLLHGRAQLHGPERAASHLEIPTVVFAAAADQAAGVDQSSLEGAHPRAVWAPVLAPEPEVDDARPRRAPPPSAALIDTDSQPARQARERLKHEEQAGDAAAPQAVEA